MGESYNLIQWRVETVKTSHMEVSFFLQIKRYSFLFTLNHLFRKINISKQVNKFIFD